MTDLAELENSIRETLHARVSHLGPERLAATDVAAPVVATPVRDQRRHSTRRLLLPVAAAAAVVAVAVGVVAGTSDDNSRHHSTPPASGQRGRAGLAGTEWRLESISHADAVQRPPAGVTATIGFDSIGGTYGNDGCNYYGGPVTVGVSTIEFGLLGTTDIACRGPNGALSTAVDHLLERANGWARTASALNLTTPDGYILAFRRLPKGTISWPGKVP